MSNGVETGRVTTNIPARLDRLPWSRFHWLVVAGLGTVWILDGLEVTLVGALAGVLAEPVSGLNLTAAQIGYAAAIYLVGTCLGALFFGQLTDRFGRKKLFLVTLVVYLVGTVLTAFSFSAWWFFLCRFFTGAGIGGEYAAITSAIDELIPAKHRGRIDLAINGSFWVGTAAGSALSFILLDPDILAQDIGWRIGFALGALLGIGVLLVRRTVPESPRWLSIHGHQEKAEAIVSRIERQVSESRGQRLTPVDDSITIRQRKTIGLGLIARTVFQLYPKRSLVCFSLFVAQAFLYNAIFFTYALVLGEFYGVSNQNVALYILLFAIGNFLGPLLLGPLFDTVGRVTMIAGTYLLSGVLLFITGQLFVAGALTATTQTALWMVTFFFASAGASSAYLTAGEVFPIETRALCIAFFYAIGVLAGGVSGPALFGNLIATGQAAAVNTGYIIGAVLMIAAGLVELLWGVKAEQQSLETITKPLTTEDAPVATTQV